jgi:predicted nuclease with TOPRIM domain
MRGFLMKIVQRQLRGIALGAAFGMVVATSSAVATTPVHDPNLYAADLAAERAQILLAAVDCGVPGDGPMQKCERHMKKALELLARVREAITRPTPTPPGTEPARTVRN